MEPKGSIIKRITKLSSALYNDPCPDIKIYCYDNYMTAAFRDDASEQVRYDSVDPEVAVLRSLESSMRNSLKTVAANRREESDLANKALAEIYSDG